MVGVDVRVGVGVDVGEDGEVGVYVDVEEAVGVGVFVQMDEVAVWTMKGRVAGTPVGRLQAESSKNARTKRNAMRFILSRRVAVQGIVTVRQSTKASFQINYTANLPTSN
jgi:hypothetical protein